MSLWGARKRRKLAERRLVALQPSCYDRARISRCLRSLILAVDHIRQLDHYWLYLVGHQISQS